jgi:hypothetical protein
MPHAKNLEPVYLIPEEQVRKIAYGRAARNNAEAKLVGQPASLKPSALIDLYYRMKGRCAISGFPLEYHDRLTHPRSIELDHIVECNRRRQLSAAISGDTADGGLIAHIDNVQWVCRFANIMKQQANQQGTDLVAICRAIAEQGEDGYPLRSGAGWLGLDGRAEFRRKVILECIKSNPVCPASLVTRKLAGTPGEANEATVRQHMRELGWSDSRPSYADLRDKAIRSVVKSHGHEWALQSDFREAVRVELLRLGVEKNPAVCWLKKQAKRMGISLLFGSTMRAVCAGDKAKLLSLLKPFGSCGMQRGDIFRLLSASGINNDLADATIDALLDFGAVYAREFDGAIVASMTREQAAEKIGVSVNRLKKWACSSWDGKDAGPPFMKSKSKSLTFYRHEDVEAFICSRGSHPFDLSVSGQRIACADGGRLGGRPPMGASTSCGSSVRL